MSELIWKITRPLAESAPVEKLEKITDITFPKDYVDCVMENNAGYPSLKVFRTNLGDERIINNLLTFDESKDVNIFNTYESLFAATGIKALIPIAEDPFGSYMCFDFSESTAKVVFWEHETNRIDAVSDTFTGFIDMLYEKE